MIVIVSGGGDDQCHDVENENNQQALEIDCVNCEGFVGFEFEAFEGFVGSEFAAFESFVEGVMAFLAPAFLKQYQKTTQHLNHLVPSN